jgi:hypothetical protein
VRNRFQAFAFTKCITLHRLPFGVIPALLQEIVSIYPLLSPPSLTNHASNRVCNALAGLALTFHHVPLQPKHQLMKASMFQ